MTKHRVLFYYNGIQVEETAIQWKCKLWKTTQSFKHTQKRKELENNMQF